jgi:hypothetical protein
VLFTGVSKCTVLFGITFAQGQFSYTSDVPITRIVIAPMIHPYAIDNLTVNTAPETPTIPVVSPPVLVGLALAVSLCGYLVSKKARPRLSPPS